MDCNRPRAVPDSGAGTDSRESVVLVNGKLRGKFRYEIVPDGNGELLLNFPVAGKSIVISQGATTFFSGTAPTVN